MSCDWGRVLDLLDMYVCMYVLIGSKVPLCCTSTQLSLSRVFIILTTQIQSTTNMLIKMCFILFEYAFFQYPASHPVIVQSPNGLV